MALQPPQSFLKKLSLRYQYIVGSFLYLTYAPKAWLYSRQRDRLERLYGRPQTQDMPTDRPGKLTQAEATDRGAKFYFEQAELDVTFLTPDLVRLDWKPGISPIPYGIARQDWPTVETILEQTPDGWRLASQGDQGIHILVNFEGHLTFHDHQGKVFREELPPERQGEHWSHHARLQPEEHVYGLGERAFPLNLRSARDENGQPPTFRMWNYDAAGKYAPGSDPMYMCIPVYVGLHQQGSYLVFYENSFDAHFKFTDVASAAFEGGALRYYVIAGTPQTLLNRYTELTGRAPLPPRWCLGYHQSRWGYGKEEEIRKTVHCFKIHDLPLAAVHLDIDVQVKNRAFTIDPDRFPQLGLFIQELAQEEVRFITILNPGIRYSRRDKLCMEGQVLGTLCTRPDGKLLIAPVWPGWCVFPDFTNPLTRRWWSRQYEYLLDVGVSGFWHDMNEPAAFILWGDRSLPPYATRHHMEGRGGDHREAHNVYGMLQVKAAYESLCRYQPQKRPFIITRAGWAGIQRYAWTWTGDVDCSWEALKTTLSTVVGLGLSGMPYAGSDIGGFQGNPDAELYLRWFQMGAFTMFCRTHSSNNVENRTPWLYGEPTLSIIREFLKLRYRLMPYLYTLTWEATQDGFPPVRPVFWADPEDSNLWGIDDAFLLGNALLVCPVTQPEVRSRSVTLPKGRWYHLWDDRVLEGPGTVEIEAPIKHIPVLVRAGCILPMEQEKVLTLHVYRPVSGGCQSMMYSDAGDGYGESRIDRFQIAWNEGGLDLIHTEEGEFSLPYETIEVQFHGASVKRAWIDGQEASIEGDRVRCDRFGQIRFEI
ncbi:MAG: glycoside hydrolase family 31 protein [Leptolyngbyaceae cyanobacterium bins.59]|nr:glycoside hydrolase family 31 protein [Leptolyngbyaceae cyanobacterium bins.59]